MRPTPLIICLLLALPSIASAVNLDINTDYQMKALSYTNLNLQGPAYDREFMTQNARFGIVIKDAWRSTSGNDERVDLGLAFHGIGVAGSSSTLQAPFDRIANNYPNTSFVPFLENAYIKLHNIFGYPWEATIGQQSFKLGSGLLLADDGAGFAGFSSMVSLPFWDSKAGVFIFQPRNSQTDATSLMVYGVTYEIPTEGVWQFNEMVEKDKNPGTTSYGLPVNDATRFFTSARYEISYGPMVFDGEIAMERGSAVPNDNADTAFLQPGGVPTTALPCANYSSCYPGNIAYKADAAIIKAKWRIPMFRNLPDGIGRIVVAHGSGYSGSNQTVDGGFMPSHGHRYDGLERDGYGEFFGATPYDVLASSPTANGLASGVSGINTVGIGFTPPSYYGFICDLDYFLYQADRNINGPDRTLGREYDIKLRYNIRDKVSFQASAGLFKVGPADGAGTGSAHRYLLQATGHF